MNGVEKKKRRKGPERLKWVLGSLLLLAVCVGAALWFGREQVTELQTATEEPANPRGTIEDRETEEIRRVTIQLRGAEPWTAVRDGNGGLRLEGEAEGVSDANLSARLEDALANIVYEAVLTENPAEYKDQMENFGLADPELTARVEYTDGKTVTLRIGASSGLADHDFHYMLVDGDDRLYAVAGSFVEDLRMEKELLHPVEQPEIQIGRIDRITVLDGDGNTAIEWELTGDIRDRDAPESWVLTTPFRYPADYDAMVSLKKNVGNLRFGVYAGEATGENLAACGLDHPAAEIRIHLAAGSTGQVTEAGVFQVTDREEESFSFLIGDERNEMTRYARWKDTICTINVFSLAPFLEAEPMDSAARYPVVLPLASLQRMTVERDGQRTDYELTWTDGETKAAENGTGEPGDASPETDGSTAGTDGETGEQQRTFTVTRNGEAMAASAFEAAYERWLTVTVSGRLPEGWEKGETTETYVFESLSGKTHRVELSRFDAMHDAVTLDGCTVFYLIRGGMGELP